MPTILIIEDDANTVRLLEIILKAAGYQVVSAPDGLQGLKLVRTLKPDLVLLDLMLPGVDGFEVCNRLRADPTTADVPILIVSVKSQEADKRMAAKAGADGYFTKPYPRAELLATIRTLLARKSRAAVALPGTGVAFISAQGMGGAATIVANVALALVSAGEPVTLVDLRPYSVEHCLLLNVAPRPSPINLTRADSAESLVTHPGGLRLLNNLEGSGEIGQITPTDARAILKALLHNGGYSLVDLSLYPLELLREAALHCVLVVFVTTLDPPAAAAARSALGVMDLIGLSDEQIGVILVDAGPARDRPVLGRNVLATLPASAGPDHPEVQALAARLRQLRRA